MFFIIFFPFHNWDQDVSVKRKCLDFIWFKHCDMVNYLALLSCLVLFLYQTDLFKTEDIIGNVFMDWLP